MPDPKALTPMFNAREEPFPMIEDRDGRLVAAVKDYDYAKKSAQMLNDILDAAVTAERERVLAEAMNVVRDAAAFEESQGDGAVTSNYLSELADRIERGERPPFEHTRAGLAYPYPQRDTDHE